MDENPYSTPESEIIEEDNQKNNEIVLADRSTRLVAAILDGLIMMAIAIPLGMVIGYISFDINNPPSVAYQVIGGLIGMAIYLILNGKLLLTKGQTIGKKIMNIQILNADTKTIPSATDLIAKRYLLFSVIGQIPKAGIIIIIDPLLIFRSNKKCLHDDFANTIVVKA